jgi:4-hydroxythreonine-4-phosphate dehydrogenase
LNFSETKVGITIGDCNGIGPEIILKIFANESMYSYFTPVIYGHVKVLKHYISLFEIEDLQLNVVKNGGEAIKGKLNVVNVVDEIEFEVSPGESTQEAGQLAFQSIQSAVEAIKNGEVHNLLTLPINKKNIHSDSFPFKGHTEFLAETFEVGSHMMLLVSDEMRVGVVTGHIPVTQISKHITEEHLSSKLNMLKESLTLDFALTKPKIAVLGLNPHSGDDGLIGTEEVEIIKPCIENHLKQGNLVYGPYPADAFFGMEHYTQFDAVLAMYHDQGLIPFKQKSFSDGVNYTAGLPIVRTSPDHGTAYDIAGKDQASITSTINALFLLKKIYNNRIEYMELNKNPLPFMKHRKEKFSIGVPNLK